MTESVWNTFKVWDNGKLTEREVRSLAADHFMDIVETFSLKGASMTLKSFSDGVYLFEIMQEK